MADEAQTPRTEVPPYLSRGERARLFPVLSENSKEGRATSIFLACLANIEEFGAAMMGSLERRVGARTRIEAFTEIVFSNKDDNKDRPDGLVSLRMGNSSWAALVESKIGSQVLSDEQVLKYVDIARQHNIDAIVTISNQLTSSPFHSPVNIPKTKLRKVNIYHWSWMFILTQAALLVGRDEIKDRDQKYILAELVRFLSHESTGIKGFSSMPKCWPNVVASIKDGAALRSRAPEIRDIVLAWHQEQKDLTLIMSRILREYVSIRLSRAEEADYEQRVKGDVEHFIKDHLLTLSLVIPNAAAPIGIVADAKARTLCASMKVVSSQERATAQGRVSWLLRQLAKSEPEGVIVRAYWPGRAPATQAPLADLREDPSLILRDDKKMAPTSFEVSMVHHIGVNFGRSQNFIGELERIAPVFYKQVGQYLQNWRPKAPKVTESKSTAEDVSPEAIQSEFESEGSNEPQS